jgi:hypothetical protein
MHLHELVAASATDAELDMFIRSIGMIVATSIAFGCAADETQSATSDPTVVVKPPAGGSAFSGSAGSAVAPFTNASQAGSGVGIGQPGTLPGGLAAPTGVAGAPAAPGVTPPITPPTAPVPPVSTAPGCKANTGDRVTSPRPFPTPVGRAAIR